MAETGGPVTQAGIRYQDQVAALYLGRMLDPRERPRHDQPVEVRIEAPQNVDDFVVCFADGSRRFFQVKLSLQARGSAWKALWPSFLRQLNADFTLGDRLELVLGEPSPLASQLSEITKRHEGSDIMEWQKRLTVAQRKLVSSIQRLLVNDIQNVWRIVTHLDISIWPSDMLIRDFVPQWMPSTTVPAPRFFRVLSEMAWEGAAIRMRFDGAMLYDRLRAEADIVVCDPQNWGGSQYRKAIVALASIEVPGTEFSQSAETAYIWPKCIRYDRNRRPDFDDDIPGWQDLSSEALVELCNFPCADLSSVVVIAGPGFGKTTLVHAIARKIALAGLLPAIIPVTKLSESYLSIAEYLSERLNSEFDVQIDWRAAVNTGSLVLLLDGLDEVSSDRRTLVLEKLKVYRANYPGLRWLVTVRDAAALAPPEDATVVELMPLQNEDVSSYVNFYRPREPHIAQDLLDKIEARPELARLVRIPIFLALMLVMRQENTSLRRSDLLDTYLETLFRPEVFKATQNDGIDAVALRRIAERVAFDALETDTVGISIRQLERCIKNIAPTLHTDEVYEAMIRRGVLRREGLARLVFPFPIVQEYLASTELLENYHDQIPERLSMIAKRPWAQAIQFALERHPNPSPLVDQILEREDDVFHTGLRLLGRCLANGMSASKAQWQTMGDRFADIWGNVSWRANKLIGSIIVDVFSQPLHPAVRIKLGKHHLIHYGADVIVARLRDTHLSLEVLAKLLDGDIEYLLNLSDIQLEVNRLGTAAFNLYIARCRQHPDRVKDGEAISALIGHMKLGSVDADTAFDAASDTTLPREVRLAAWNQSLRELDPEIEKLIIQAMTADGYHPMASAAKALSSPQVDITAVIRLLQSPQVPQKNVLNVMDYLFSDWRKQGRTEIFNELIATDGISKEMQNLASLYAINAGFLSAFSGLLDRIPKMNSEMVSATVALFGHMPERSSVEQAVSAIACRKWNVKDRVSIASSLTTGLTYRMNMFEINAGTLEPIPPHPGRTVPFSLLEKWMAQDDYEPHDYLRLVFDAAKLGVPRTINRLRKAFDAAIVATGNEEHSDGALAGRALELLHANGKAPPLDELEQLALSATYNLASSVIGIIAKGGGELEAQALMRLYENVSSPMLRLTILDRLEPLAGRLGLRITHSGKKLMATVS